MQKSAESACWIWYPGDFEIYHYMMRHTRRQTKDARVPAFWRVSRPELAATFELPVDLAEPRTITVVSHGLGRVQLDGFNHGNLNEQLTIPAGVHTVTVHVYNREAFPSIFVADEPFTTGPAWKVHCFDKQWKEPESEPKYFNSADDPAIFPFLYKTMLPVCTEVTENGVLYDFGEERFGPVTVKRTEEMGEIRLSYGESKPEALDWDETILREKIAPGNGAYEAEARAFRYLCVSAENGVPEISALSEYLDLPDAASFSCDREIMNRIWDVCLRTVHINAREFYLDGPKQDGWVWAGDAYQAYMAGRYLFRDQAITRRTIRANLGKLPIVQHSNTINDYSCYQIISLWEYYFATGDLAFVKQVWPETRALYEFTVSRLEEETGYMIGRPGDWIFIDWSTIDKTDPNSTEQILLWQVHRVIGRLAEALGEPMPETAARAEALQANIMRDFWNEEKGAFICTPTTGENLVTRHASIMAILYDFVPREQQELLCKNVLLDPAVVPITTPFFKFFELLALSKVGHIEEAQDFMESYWGDMVKLGATTVWEQYNPNESGMEHLAMYGQKFGRSLCHVWGSGPITILGQYVAGVRPTSVGGRTFTVEPQIGCYKRMDATFPVAEGEVRLVLDDGTLSVTATVGGGTLVLGDRQYELIPGEACKVSLNVV